MYLSYYGLLAQPFQLRPDTRFYFDNASHQRAMAYLDYGLDQGEGFIVITGDAGAGKTTLLRKLFEKLVPAQVHAAQVAVDGEDLLRMVAAGFALPSEPMSKAALLANIEAMLRRVDRQGRRSLLVIDEAHKLSARALEELRMLSHIQAGQRALLQIFLIGQPPLRETLKSPVMEQLSQRVIAAHHLGPINAIETRAYIEHRLRTAGWQGKPAISVAAFASIYMASGGNPRRINTLCERLLQLGFLDQASALDATHVATVLRDLAGEMAAAAPAATTGASGLVRTGLPAAGIEQSMLALLGAVQSLPGRAKAARTSEQA
jgi:general secretion pathway protein A